MEEKFNLTAENYKSFVEENEISTFSVRPKKSTSITVFQAKEDIPVIRSIRKPNQDQVLNIAFSVARKGQFVAFSPDGQLWIMDHDHFKKNYKIMSTNKRVGQKLFIFLNTSRE